MKRLLITATTAILLTGAAVYAQAPTPPADGGPRLEQRGERGERMRERMERRAERMDERFNRRIERLKTELKLTPAQEPLFAQVEQQMRRQMAERREYWRGNMQRLRNAELPDRLDMMADRATRGASSLRELSSSVKPLWATLSDEQKATVRRMMPGRGEWRGEGRGEGRGERRG